ncbi:MAG: alcohol dehydrogenase catalytic domain-containing protein [Cyanobacteria bacterium]|nr:alcohol dehydrogenase catalytic domain-containing protein [Cyanobacteria bacterium GSL.Bin1]
MDVQYCGICHSDVSIVDNDWGVSQYPVVPGHEVVGTVAAVGDTVQNLAIGEQVGLGWFSSSCMSCEWCLSGDHNLCHDSEQTIVGRYGGFADKVRAHQNWVFRLPEGLNPETAGPLFCGGITVFNPIVQLNIKSSDRVGVIGIGGLGHMALQFLKAWGCEVTAFSGSAEKETEARNLGAHHFVNSRDPEAVKAVKSSFDVILSTVNGDLDWETYMAALRPRGRLHFLGVPPNPIAVQMFSLLFGQKSISASPVGSPGVTKQMLEFLARKQLEPMVEFYPFDKVNEAMDQLRHGKPRYRIVLKR